MFTTAQTFSTKANTAQETRDQIKAAKVLGFRVSYIDARGTWVDGSEDTIFASGGIEIVSVGKGKSLTLKDVSHEGGCYYNHKARPDTSDEFSPGHIIISFKEGA